MANEYYDHTTYPSTGALGSSSAMRAELNSVEAGFDKLPTLTGNGGKLLKVNSGGTAQETVSADDVVDGSLPTVIHAATSKPTPVGSDEIGIWDSVSGLLRKLTFANLVTYLQTAFASLTFSVGYGTAAGHAVRLDQIRGYIDGLTFSTDGSSNSFATSTGVAMDSTNSVMMKLSASISKTTGAWVVGTGNGVLDAGSIAANTWYRRYLIYRADTGVIDVIASTNFTTPTLPTNYTHYRAIGFIKTDGSSNWVDILQDGDWNKFDTQSASDASFSGAGSALITLPTPVGVRLKVKLSGYVSGGGSTAILVTDPAQTDSACSNKRLTAIVPSTSGHGIILEEVFTDTSARVRVNSNDASITGGVSVVGWYDLRGRE